MKRILFGVSLLMLVAMTACRASTIPTARATPSTMVLTSPVFTNDGAIPDVYSYTGCNGKNLSPALNWGEPPAGTKSFALIMDDPDAKRATFVHWVLYNIPATVRGLPEGVHADPNLQDGSVQGTNGINTIGYIGPCPPSGMHRYSFRLYAMDVAQLDPAFSMSSDQRDADIDAHALAKAELTGIFTKK